MRRTKLAICIAGMHRSGTSMVARLFQSCGLYLGPEEELGFDLNNGEPHWENVKFVALNDEILGRLGGSWDNPPVLASGWERTPAIQSLASEAKKLIKQFSRSQHWGWKDPRNSLTWPFWQRLVPNLKTVICLRNPWEVSQSLRVRGDSIPMPLYQLWLTYGNQLLLAMSRPSVVTHYESYFQDPVAELQRVTNAVGMQVSPAIIDRASADVANDLRHHRANYVGRGAMNVPQEVISLYRRLCREAGPNYQPEQDPMQFEHLTST